MRFPEREVKPYGEPVEPDQLKIGNVYFEVFFLDEDGLIPLLQPRVFIGRDLDAGDKDKLYFQDYSSYRNGVRYDSDPSEEEGRYQTGAEKRIFEYEKALDILLGCSLRRAKAAG